jgi:hypothetical protein
MLYNTVKYSARPSTKVISSSFPANASRGCYSCSAMSSTKWRPGPLGPRTLCNACGIREVRGKKRYKISSWPAEAVAELEKEQPASKRMYQRRQNNTSTFAPALGNTEENSSGRSLRSQVAKDYRKMNGDSD